MNTRKTKANNKLFTSFVLCVVVAWKYVDFYEDIDFYSLPLTFLSMWNMQNAKVCFFVVFWINLNKNLVLQFFFYPTKYLKNTSFVETNEKKNSTNTILPAYKNTYKKRDTILKGEEEPHSNTVLYFAPCGDTRLSCICAIFIEQTTNLQLTNRLRGENGE